MAFTSSADYTNWGSSASVSAITFTGQSILVGDILVIGWCANVASLTYTISDNSTQPGDANIYTLRPILNGTTFTSGTCYCLRVTREILTSDTITITITGGPVTRSAGHAHAWTPGNGNAQLENRSAAANDTTSPVAAAVMGTTQWQSNELAVLYGYWKGGAVGAGFTNSSTNMTGAGTGTSALSGGVTTRVEVNYANSVTLGLTAWGPSASYTSITVANVEGLTFSDRIIPAAALPACRQYHSMPRNFAGSSITAEIGPCVAGNLLILAVATNENAGTDNINTPAGWNLAGTFRQGTTDINIAVFTKISAGGETTQTVTTSVAQRVVVHWSEWVGFLELQDGSPATAGSTATVTTLTSGTVTPSGPGRLYYAFIVEKNAGPLTAAGTVTAELAVNNEAGANSTQKEAGGVYVDANRSAAASSAPTVGTASGYASMAFLFLAEAPLSPQVALDRNNLSDERPRYVAPLSQVFSNPYETIAPPAALPAGLAQSRQVVNYVSPRSSTRTPFDAAFNVLKDIAGLTQSRPVPDYVAPRSRTMTPFDPLYNVAADIAAFVRSRLVENYKAPRSRTADARDEFHGSETAGSVQGNRPPARYTPPVSTVWGVIWEPVAPPPGTEFAGSVQSYRAPFRYVAPLSQVMTPFDPAYNVQMDWASMAVTSPQRKQAPSVSFVAQVPVAPDSPALAQFLRSRQEAAKPVRSFVFTPGVTTDVPVGSLFARSARRDLANQIKSFVSQTPIPDAVAANNIYVQFVRSRQVERDPDVRSLVIMALGDGSVIVTPLPNMGGGGEWVIWEKPDFPGNRPDAWRKFKPMDFKRPTRRERRGY